jgi:hypothetical protein
MPPPLPDPESPGFAIIDGCLCKLNRRGTVLRRLQPLGGRVLCFLSFEGRLLVLEQADGFLGGMPNLYCLDEGFRLLWLAETPASLEAWAGLVGVQDGLLHCTDLRGGHHELCLTDGRLQQTC